MSKYGPPGLSDEDDDDEGFELSTDFDTDYNYRKQTCLQNIPETEESIFYTALKSEDMQTMQTMMANGFHVDQPLSGGWSPLMYACSLGLLPIIEFLVASQANVNFNKELFTSLMALCKSRSSDEDNLVKCLDLLLNHGANINATDRNACTALMYACSSGHLQLVKKLIDCQCDVNIQDVEGWSALFHAVSEGREDIIQVLLEGKTRVDLIDKRRRSAFELAKQKGYDHIGKLVCSKKEKRRLLNEDSLPVSEKTTRDPVEELLVQLPSTNFKNNSGFSSDISKLLWAMQLGHFSKLFAENNVQLNEFLLITDERLKELGVRFSVHRQRILSSIKKFHLHQWNKASLGMKPRNQQMDVVDGVKLMCNVTKHLHVLNATINYVRIHQPVPIRPDVFNMCERAAHQLNLITNELGAIHSYASQLKEKEKIEPVDLIKPRKQSKSSFVPILVPTVLLGLLIWKNKINISFFQKVVHVLI